jgi:secondary thiamine-phosphate synthase enzyme
VEAEIKKENVMLLKTIHIKTTCSNEMIDITRRLDSLVCMSNIKEGIAVIYTPHTTAAITINENADPSVTKDILYEMNKIVPTDDNYKHSEGNSDAHIKSSMFGVSETVIIHEGRFMLGRWQGIYFCEFDGPRTRSIIVKIFEC